MPRTFRIRLEVLEEIERDDAISYHDHVAVEVGCSVDEVDDEHTATSVDAAIRRATEAAIQAGGSYDAP